MPVRIKIPASFGSLIQGEKFIYTKPGKITDVLKDIEKKYPLLAQKIIDKGYELKAGILIFRDEKYNKYFLMKDEEVLRGQKLVLIIPTAGG